MRTVREHVHVWGRLVFFGESDVTPCHGVSYAFGEFTGWVCVVCGKVSRSESRPEGKVSDLCFLA